MSATTYPPSSTAWSSCARVQRWDNVSASFPFPTLGFLNKAVVDGQQRFFLGLARVAVGENERERAQDVGKVVAGKAVQVSNQRVEFVAQGLAFCRVSRAFGFVPLFAHDLLPQLGKIRRGAGEAGSAGGDGVEVGVASGQAGQWKLVKVKEVQ